MIHRLNAQAEPLQRRLLEEYRAGKKPTQAYEKATGRTGTIVVHDPVDTMLSYKLSFDDGQLPGVDWFAASAVAEIPGGSVHAPVCACGSNFKHCSYRERSELEVEAHGLARDNP